MALLEEMYTNSRTFLVGYSLRHWEGEEREASNLQHQRGLNLKSTRCIWFGAPNNRIESRQHHSRRRMETMSVVRLASAQTSPSSTVLAVPVEDTEDTDMALSAPAISSNGSASLLRNRPHHPKPRHPHARCIITVGIKQARRMLGVRGKT